MSDKLKILVEITDEVLPGQSKVTLRIPGGSLRVFKRGTTPPVLQHEFRNVPADRVHELRAMGYRVEVIEGDDPLIVAEERRARLLAAMVRESETPRRRGRRRKTRS